MYGFKMHLLFFNPALVSCLRRKDLIRSLHKACILMWNVGHRFFHFSIIP